MRELIRDTVIENTNDIQRRLIFDGFNRLDDLHIEYEDEITILYRDITINNGLEGNLVNATYQFINKLLTDTLGLFKITVGDIEETHRLLCVLLDTFTILENVLFLKSLHDNPLNEAGDIFAMVAEESFIMYKDLLLDNIHFGEFYRDLFIKLYTDETNDTKASDEYVTKLRKLDTETNLGLTFIEVSLLLDFRGRGLKDLVMTLTSMTNLAPSVTTRIVYAFKTLNGYMVNEEEFEALNLTKPRERREFEPIEYWDNVFNKLI